MRNVGLVAFGVTTCLLVPAAVSLLTAGREQVRQLFIPATASVTLDDGTKIDAKVDRAVIDPGESVHLTLNATGVAGKHVSVGVLVLGASGNEGDRVPSPPIGVAHRTVKLQVDATGHATGDLALRLHGVQAEFDPLAHYTIYVMEPRAAARLERLRSNSELIMPRGGGIPSYNKSGEKFVNARWALERSPEMEVPDAEDEDGSEGAAPAKPAKGAVAARGDEAMFAPGKAARLDVHTRPVSSAIAIATPATSPVGESFTVAVTVTNPSKRARRALELRLESLDGLIDTGRVQYQGLASGDVTIEPAQLTFDLAGHETRRVEFRVTAKKAGTVGLYARAGTTDESFQADALWAGAIDATEIVSGNPVIGAR